MLSARVRLPNGQWSALGQPRYTLAVNQPPIWAVQADIQFPTGLALEIPLSVSDPDLPPQPLTLGASGLPPGLMLDTNSVRIGGTGAAMGNYPVTVTASDGQSPPLGRGPKICDSPDRSRSSLGTVGIQTEGG